MEKDIFISLNKDKAIMVAPISEMDSVLGYLENVQYKFKSLLVIGNGFDLNLGLPTTYRNFVESCIFKKMYVKRLQKKKTQKIQQPSLIDYLYGKKFYERWYDIEQALLEYVSRRPDGGFVNNIKQDREDYFCICKSLIEYLSSLFKSNNLIDADNTPAAKILNRFLSRDSLIYSFNYTPIDLIIRSLTFSGYSSNEKTSMHGEIKADSIIKGNIHGNSIILGIETDNIDSIAPGYSFMIKSNNPIYKSTMLASDLLASREVVFFGHSLNKMDFGYFDQYLRYLTTNKEKGRRLTIITKNEESRVTILNNIRQMGISVRDIFSHVKIDMILTDNIGKPKSEDSNNFDELLNRLKGY